MPSADVLAILGAHAPLRPPRRGRTPPSRERDRPRGSDVPRLIPTHGARRAHLPVRLASRSAQPAWSVSVVRAPHRVRKLPTSEVTSIVQKRGADFERQPRHRNRPSDPVRDRNEASSCDATGGPHDHERHRAPVTHCVVEEWLLEAFTHERTLSDGRRHPAKLKRVTRSGSSRLARAPLAAQCDCRRLAGGVLDNIAVSYLLLGRSRPCRPACYVRRGRLSREIFRSQRFWPARRPTLNEAP
jgi:hypothetical protein